MLFADVVERIVHAALEDAEKVFDVVRREPALGDVPTVLVEHALMRSELATDLLVDFVLVGNERALAVGIRN